jgi:hypothetical protein
VLSLQPFLNFSVQNLVLPVFTIKHFNEPLHVFAGFSYVIGYTSLIDQCSVLLFGPLGLCSLEAGLVKFYRFVIVAFLLI